MTQQGLLQPEAPAGGAPPGGEAAAPGEEPQGGLSPEQQKKFDIYIAQGIRIIHDEKVTSQMLQHLEGSQDPVTVFADTTLGVIKRLDEESGKQGFELEIELKAHAANLLMGELMTIAESAGLQPLDDEQRYQAYSLAVSKYIDNAVKTGKMSQDELVQLGEQAKGTPEGQKIMQHIQGGGGTPGGGMPPGGMPPGQRGV